MKGHVMDVNPRKGFVAIQTDDGITVMELLGGYDVDLEDIITGEFENHGGEIVHNLTKGEDMSVYIQSVHCTPNSARTLMV